MTRRRSRLRSITKSDSSQKSEDGVMYCICRSSDGSRFMIACDNCEEWYHGDCINVTPKQADNIKRFFCHLCIGRNPSLEIEYKSIKENRPRLPNLRQQIKKISFSSDEENDADLSSVSSPDKYLTDTKGKRVMRKRWHPLVVESVGKKRRGRPKERQDDYDEEATEDEIETSGFVLSRGDFKHERHEHPQTHRSNMAHKYPRGTRNINDDCNGAIHDPDYHCTPNMRRKNEFEIAEIRQRLINQPNKDNYTIGSKMRRGDHLPGGLHRGNVSLSYNSYDGAPYQSQDRSNYGLSTNKLVNESRTLRRGRTQSDIVAVTMSSNTSSASGPYIAGNESEEDVMIPGEVMPPKKAIKVAAGMTRNYNNYQPESCTPTKINSDKNNYQYGLNYPDHLYCKHHRYFDWHNSMADKCGQSKADTSILKNASLQLSSPSSPELDIVHSHIRSSSLEPVNCTSSPRTRSCRPTAIPNNNNRKHKSQINRTLSLVGNEEDSIADYKRLPSTFERHRILNSNTHMSDIIYQSHLSTNDRALTHGVYMNNNNNNTHQPAQDFYIINDEQDDLEINWPKETVNA